MFTILGFNDNPTAQQFEAAFRKLLVHNDVVSSKYSNCMDSRTKILSVSSNRPSTSKSNVCESGALMDDWLTDDFFEMCQHTDQVEDHSIA